MQRFCQTISYVVLRKDEIVIGRPQKGSTLAVYGNFQTSVCIFSQLKIGSYTSLNPRRKMVCMVCKEA